MALELPRIASLKAGSTRFNLKTDFETGKLSAEEKSFLGPLAAAPSAKLVLVLAAPLCIAEAEFQPDWKSLRNNTRLAMSDATPAN